MHKCKRGGTHVGFVLSFVIFVTFIVIIYAVLIVPNLSHNDKKYLVENLKIKLLGNVSSELAVINIKTESAPQNCIRIHRFLSDFSIGSGLIVKDKSENLQVTYAVGDDLEISRNNNNTFFIIYESDAFKAAGTKGETPCNPRIYETGIAKKDVYIFENSVRELMNYYNENYDGLRNNFNFPNDSDFDFGFTYSNGTYIKVERQTSSSIYSTEIPIQYLDVNANILPGFVNIRVW